MGLIGFVLMVVKRLSFGTVNLQAFWFPAPFYDFWKAKLKIDLVQINGCKICTTATQGDAYMKFCTEAMLNFWTLGFYGRCCSKRTNYGRWLDRHLLWQGTPPKGYNNREAPPLELHGPVSVRRSRTLYLRSWQSSASLTRSTASARRSRSSS